MISCYPLTLLKAFLCTKREGIFGTFERSDSFRPSLLPIHIYSYFYEKVKFEVLTNNIYVKLRTLIISISNCFVLGGREELG